MNALFVKTTNRLELKSKDMNLPFSSIIKNLSLALCIAVILPLIAGCQQNKKKESLDFASLDMPQIAGKAENMGKPYVTAGDRVYVVGHQDGSFPDFGWHTRGEMAGIWNHPIKLMDGFTLSVTEAKNDMNKCLTKADGFIAYPIVNSLVYKLEDEGLEITRSQFVPDGAEGAIITIKVENKKSDIRDLTINFTTMVDLLPVWLSDSLGIYDSKDTFTWNGSQIIAKDSLNPWHLVVGSSVEAAILSPAPLCVTKHQGNGVDATMQISLPIQANSANTVQFYIAGSYKSEKDAQKTYKTISNDPTSLLKSKWQRYQQFTAFSEINVPDSEIATMYQWIRYNTDWLIRDVPEQGRGLSAGIPDFPWWFGADNCYALQGLLSTGQHDEVKKTLELILKLSKDVNDDGRIMHEASTNGVVFNRGNLNETPQFITLMWDYYRWTGDKSLINQYYPDIKKGIEWITDLQDKDKNGYPDGPGMMEIHGLHSEMIDVVVYTQQALAASAKIALAVNDTLAASIYDAKAKSLADQINKEWWVASDSSYADFRATKAQAIELIEAAIVRADTIDKPLAKQELIVKLEALKKSKENGVQSFVVHHNWVVNTPMETKIALPEYAESALRKGSAYTNRFGVYVTGMDRDENDMNREKWSTFSYVGSVMTLPTGVQAVAEAQYGNSDQSLKYLKNLSKSFSFATPGTMYEVSPDYGQIVQAWNIYGVAVPIVNHFFGISPDAQNKEITLKPQFPSEWDNAEIKNVKIGDTEISIKMRISGEETSYEINNLNQSWKIKLDISCNTAVLKVNGKGVELSGKSRSFIGNLKDI